jgi:site-specific DNA recombinase
MEKTKSVGIWIRVSTEDQARGDSPEHHEKRARHYAEAKGWRVREVYHLEAVSGKSVSEHPETKRMLEHVRTGHITGLVFSKLARLARNTRELLDFSDFFREHDADLISLQESIDTSSPAGRLFYTMIAAMATWEREEIADRVAASVPIRAKMGKKVAGATILGYQYKEGKFSVDATEAPVRKLIYDLFLGHRRMKAVARILNERGYRTRKGAKFSDTTVTRLIRDTTTVARYRANYTRKSGKDRLLKPKEDRVYIKVPPIVSEELWNECNGILDDQQRKKKPPAKKTVHLFAGFAYCDCGTKMYVPSNSPKYTCPKCRNKIGVTDLEEVFHHQLQSFFMSPTEVQGYLAKADQVIKEKEELLRSLEEEKKRVLKERERVYRSYIDEEIDVKTYGSQFRPLEERVRQIDEQIPELQGEIDFLKIQYLSSDRILQEAQDLHTRWPQLVKDEKRKIIESITENITIGKEDISINLCYLPSSSENVAERQRTHWSRAPTSARCRSCWGTPTFPPR